VGAGHYLWLHNVAGQILWLRCLRVVVLVEDEESVGRDRVAFFSFVPMADHHLACHALQTMYWPTIIGRHAQ